MAFDGADLKFDLMQHGTNLLSDGYQTRDGQTQAQYNRAYSSAQTTFAGRVQQAQFQSSDTINQRHRGQIMPEREAHTDNLRLTTNTFGDAQETAVGQLSQPASGIGAQINPPTV